MTPKEIMAHAKALIAADLPRACAEIVEWRDTAVLGQGLVRQAAAVLAELDSHRNVYLAESIVLDMALRQVARP